MVLCHGGPGMWDYLAPVAAMVEEVRTVYRYDQRGCGRSPSGELTLERYIADLDDVCHLTGHERVIVGEHWWGASLALFYRGFL